MIFDSSNCKLSKGLYVNEILSTVSGIIFAYKFSSRVFTDSYLFY